MHQDVGHAMSERVVGGPEALRCFPGPAGQFRAEVAMKDLASDATLANRCQVDRQLRWNEMSDSMLPVAVEPVEGALSQPFVDPEHDIVELKLRFREPWLSASEECFIGPAQVAQEDGKRLSVEEYVVEVENQNVLRFGQTQECKTEKWKGGHCEHPTCLGDQVFVHFSRLLLACAPGEHFDVQRHALRRHLAIELA